MNLRVMHTVVLAISFVALSLASGSKSERDRTPRRLSVAWPRVSIRSVPRMGLQELGYVEGRNVAN